MLSKLIDCKCSESWIDASKLILRVVLGAIFFYHGYGKFGMGNEAIAGFFSSVGIPIASFFAPLVTWVEMIGGIALMAGFLTHWTAKLLAIVAVVAFFTVHINNGFDVSKGGYEFVLLIFASLVMIMTAGAGRWSIDGIMKKDNSAI